MKVDLLDGAMVNSDLGVVNAARCSFDKESAWDYVCTDETCTGTEGCSREHITPVIKAADAKLIQYLTQHQHWTPFAHAQEVFELHMQQEELLHFFLTANLSGFEWVQSLWNNTLHIRGSLYAWVTNLNYLPSDIRYTVWDILQVKYPISVNNLISHTTTVLTVSDNSRAKVITNLKLKQKELVFYTLRIHCPIFVKRQLETHRRNFVMTDIEDFSQNEVSRRYIDTEPELYIPPTWRIQSPNKKQGSSEEMLQSIDEYIVNANYAQHTHNSLLYYKQFNSLQIAHEQSRMILPTSTYTTFWWTGSLKSWQRMLTLRLDSHAQSETREVAQLCYNVIPI